MDFSDTPEQAAFRADARRFLEANAEPRRAGFETWTGRHGETQGLALAKAFQAKKAAAGFAAITWPMEYGGRGLSPIFHVIWTRRSRASSCRAASTRSGWACASRR